MYYYFKLFISQLQKESGEDLRRMIQCQEAFVIQYQESSKRQGKQLSLSLCKSADSIA